MSKKAFGSNGGLGVREFWPTVRRFQIDLSNFWADESCLKGDSLCDAYQDKLSQVERMIGDIQLAMLDVRLSLKHHVQQYQLPFSVGVSGKKFTRALAIQWRMRKSKSGAAGRGRWIPMTEWPKQLAEANIPESVRHWYADATAILIILNTQSMAAFALRNGLSKNITHVAEIYGIESDEPGA